MEAPIKEKQVDGRVNNGGPRGGGRPRNVPTKIGHKIGKKKGGGGRKVGVKNRRTIEREVAEGELRAEIPKSLQKKGGVLADAIIQATVAADLKRRIGSNSNKLFNAQLSLALGTQHLYRVRTEINDKGKEIQKHSLVTNEKEIRQFLDDPKKNNGDEYFYITTKDPSEASINSLLDRYLGKAPTKLIGAENPDGSEGPVRVVVANFVPSVATKPKSVDTAESSGVAAQQIIHEVVEEENGS